MRIGIDARLIQETGVGRYIRNLIAELARLDTTNEYVIFLRKKEFDFFILPNNRWSKVIADVPWHSVSEQLIIPWVFLRARLDIVHIPYFNVPILYPKKFIVTIHDLTILHADTGKASTKPLWFYKIKRAGYRCILWVALLRASHVLTVSYTVKEDIHTQFQTPLTNITVTYEGIDEALLDKKRQPTTMRAKYGRYFLYVGNVYPHKNIEMLLSAYETYAAHVERPARLVFVGPDDYFYAKLKRVIGSLAFAKNITLLHNVADASLRQLYTRAIALLFPSRMEGFGLPAIEASALGCAVICSDIPVFHEILGSNAIFVDTTDANRFSQALIRVDREPIKNDESAKLIAQIVAKYSWTRMVQKTVWVYTEVNKK